jgi:predicted Zn-dependent protease
VVRHPDISAFSLRVACSVALVLACAGPQELAAAAGAQAASNFATLSARADAARDANHLEEATSLYRKALALRPTWKEGWWSLGTIYYDADAYKAAAPAFRRLIAIDPKNGTAHMMLGLCEYQLRLYPSSMKHIQAAKRLGIKKDEQLERVLLYHEGMLWLQERSYENAVEPLGSLAKQGVHSDELDSALGMAVLLIPPQAARGDRERHVLMAAGRAEAYSLTKNWEEARKGYRDLVREFPDFPNVYYAYGRFLLSIEATEEARTQFKDEIKRNPSHIRARMQIAATYYRMDSAEGIPYALEVVKLKPDYPFGHYLLGLLYFDSGNLSRSVPELEAAVRMVPQEPQFQFALGNAYARTGRKADAARARAAFRRLGGDVQSSGASNPYGDQQTLKLGHVPDPSPSRESRGPR